MTGHTGFKGSWLSLWLLQLGAGVHGLSLAPETSPNLFEQLNLKRHIGDDIGNICDEILVHDRIFKIQPDVIFHLAAQPIVRKSYTFPHQTWNTNVMGTLNILNAVRKLNKRCVCVIVTTDKVYENCESGVAYVESDRLGGHDPYSASKAAVEILVSSWKRSYSHEGTACIVASARAGNVIGGGDWTEHRIIPDLFRAWANDQQLVIRNPNSERPWQHVLEPLSGYLKLGEALYQERLVGGPYNFGPCASDVRTTKELVEEMSKHWSGSFQVESDPNQNHEAKILRLNSDRAQIDLGYSPRWDLSRGVKATADWYKNYLSGDVSIEDLTVRQITEFGLP